MEVRIEDIGPCKKRLSIKVPPEKVAEEIEKGIAELAATVHFPGFRVGKVPHELVEKRFKKRVLDEVKQNSVRDSLREALEENGLDMIGMPELDDIEHAEDTGLSYTATIEVRPEINIENYKGIELTRSPTEVTPDEVERLVEDTRKRLGIMQDAPDGKVTEDSFVRANCEILVEGKSVWKQDGVVFSVSDGTILGLTIDGLSGSMVGKTAGDTVDFSLALPEGFMIEEHRGKPGKLKVTVVEARQLIPAELGEAVFERLGARDEKDLRERFRAQIQQSKEGEAQRLMRRQLADKMIEMAHIELPEDLVTRAGAEMKERNKRILQYQGASEEQLEHEDETITRDSQEAARRQVAWHFIVEDIAAKEKIFATEEDVNGRIAAMASQANRRPAAVRTELERQGDLVELRGEIRKDKTIQFLLEKAKVKVDEGPQGQQETGKKREGKEK